MCKTCAQAVREMDVRDTDLPNLPYTPARWHCITEGCKNHVTVRDYGLSPYYYWPVKVRVKPNGRWRGGWFDPGSHWYMCSRCWNKLEKRQMAVPRRTPQIMISKLIVNNKK